MRSPTWERWFALTSEQRLFIIAAHFQKIDQQKIDIEILREYFKLKVNLDQARADAEDHNR